MTNLPKFIIQALRKGYLLLVIVLFSSLCSSCGAKARASRAETMFSSSSMVYDENGKLLADPDCRAYQYHAVAPTGDLVQDLITLGRKFIGKPYRYRGPSPWAMDCSGYVRYLFSCFGIHLRGSSADLAQVARSVRSPKPGDLLFFKGRNQRSSRIGHVALVVKVDGSRITMMHSTNSRGIVQEVLQSNAYFSSRYIRAGRLPHLERMYASYREAEAEHTPKPVPASAIAWQAPNLFSTPFFGCIEDGEVGEDVFAVSR
ncbi:MAG: C40 family peptidase [Bacteroidales bacterium]|nr:C40 family peptidase [Porphyromonas sp.]MDD6934241.1 C40 family peptidase [Bacteroidales bacterium]MDY3101622.1 C40 family peptidase [Porphyromonas sp.]